MGIEIFSLEGKTALVTGASRGIGAGIAVGFAEAGADVALAARTVADLEAVAGKIAAIGRRAVVIPCDVTDAEQVRACVDKTIADLGHLDILVNNAGGNRFMFPVVATREDGWDKGMALNLRSAFLFCKYAGPHMLERGGGSIINMSTAAALRSSPTLAAYAAAKAGLISLTRTLAAEFGNSGPRVNAICPGWVKTALNENLWGNPATKSAVVQAVPMGRWGKVEEIVPAAIFLASDASSYVTGSALVVDGGQTA